MVPVSITIDGEYSSYYYTMFEYETNLENPDVYPDAMLYQTLVYYGVNYAEKVNFRAPWNKAVMIAAMAIDKEGRYSRVYRQKVTFKKYQASDINELFSRAAQSAPVKCVKAVQPAKSKVEKNPAFGKEALRERKLEVKQNGCVFRSLI